MADAQSILAPLQIPNSVKADAWDAYNQATSSDDMAARLKKLPLQDSVRANLWDAHAAKLATDAAPATVGGFVKNAATSTGNLLSNIGTAIRHPYDALHGAADIVAGGLNSIGVDEKHPSTDTGAAAESDAKFDQFVGALKQKYGSWDKIKHTLYNDPAGAAMDISMALDGVGGVVGKVGEAADAAKLTSVANASRAVQTGVKTAATYTNPIAVPAKAVGALVSPLTRRIAAGFQNPNPVEAAAAEFGRANDIPVDAGVATGNKFIQGVQALSDRTPIGSVVAANAKAAEGAAMERVGGEISDQVHPNAVAPAQAGRDVTSSIESTIAQHHAEANAQYDTLRDIEKDPANVRNVQTGTKQVPAVDAKSGQVIPGKFTTEPVMEDIALPVDLRDVKAALRPAYNQIMRQLPITQQRASTGIKALENIINGPDAAPASQVDMDLGSIKAAARGADLPELKTLSQGLAAQAVQQLHDAVTTAVGRAERTSPAGAAPASAAQNPPGWQNPNATGNMPAAAAPAPVATAASAPAATPTPIPTPTATRIPIPNSDRAYDAEYHIVDRNEVQASHNAQTFSPNPQYGLKNERNYNNPVNQAKVVENSTPERFDIRQLVNDNADATAGPPIVDEGGNALAGNGRTMYINRAYDADPGSGFGMKDHLVQRAKQFGTTPEAVKAMQEPMLVRVVGEDQFTRPGFSKADAIRDFNIPGTAALTPAEQAIADARRVSQPTLDHVASELEARGNDATLAQVLEGKSGVTVLNKLMEDGVIARGDLAGLTTENALTKAGKDRISQLMLGRFFRDAEQLDNVAPAVKGKLERIAAPAAALEGEGPYSLTLPIKGAMDLLEAQRAHGSTTLEEYLDQSSLFARQRYSPESIELARQLQQANPTEITAAIRKFTADAKYATSYEGPGMFNDLPEPKTPREAFNDAFGTTLKEEAAPAAAPPSAIPAKPADFDASFKPTPAPVVKTAPALGTRVGSAAGQEALDALTAGRAATAAKYDAAGILKSLPKSGEEGRQVFEQAIWRNDAGIAHLREIQRIAPAEIPKIGRAFLDDLMGKATAEGGFKGGASLQARWQGLGPETKQVLFPNPLMRKDLDNFFLLAKRAGESANPSATSLVTASGGSLALAFTHPLTGIPMIIGSGALSALLHSPRAVEALTQGFSVPLANKAQAAFVTAKILRVAGQAAQPASQLPIAAQAAPPPQTDQPALTASR